MLFSPLNHFWNLAESLADGWRSLWRNRKNSFFAFLKENSYHLWRTDGGQDSAMSAKFSAKDSAKDDLGALIYGRFKV